MTISRVTVLIATYNQAKYIAETINSVLDNVRQLKQNSRPVIVELIVVDDGSTDETAEVVKQFEKHIDAHFELKYVHQQNQGQSAAYENVLDKITGEIVFLLDSDDLFLPEKINKVIKAFEENPEIGMVGHPLYVIDSNGNRTGDFRPKAAKISHGDVRDIIKKYGRIVAPATSGLAFRADLFREIHPNPLRGISCAADGYLTMAAALCTTIYNLEEPLAEYRQHGGSQYFRRMTSIDGLRKTLDIHERITNHLGLEDTLEKNSYTMRNIFAYTKMTSSMTQGLKSVVKLIRAIFSDPFMSVKAKMALSLYWGFASLFPKKVFWAFWIRFQQMHTGFREKSN